VTFYIVGKKKYRFDVNQVAKYRVIIGKKDNIHPVDLRIVAARNRGSCRFFYLG
jgi:hypothetical protein